jgi:hypothetical protein
MIDFEALEQSLTDFMVAKPFPHLIIDDFIVPEFSCDLIKDYPQSNWTGWIEDSNAFQQKQFTCESINLFPESLATLAKRLMDPQMCLLLKKLSNGIPIYPDPYFEGAGLQAMSKGGVLAPHLDPANHPTTFLDRAFSLIIYLDNAPENHGGELVFYDGDEIVKTISPKQGRCVLFQNLPNSKHAVKEWQNDTLRKSLILFYYKANPDTNNIAMSQRGILVLTNLRRLILSHHIFADYFLHFQG